MYQMRVELLKLTLIKYLDKIMARTNLLKTNKTSSGCNKVLSSKEALLFNIPIANFAVFFYSFIIILLLRGFYLKELNLYWLSIVVSFKFLATIYFALVMFFKLRSVCIGCIRIYLANSLMASSLASYYLI